MTLSNITLFYSFITRTTRLQLQSIAWSFLYSISTQLMEKSPMQSATAESQFSVFAVRWQVYSHQHFTAQFQELACYTKLSRKLVDYDIENELRTKKKTKNSYKTKHKQQPHFTILKTKTSPYKISDQRNGQKVLRLTSV